MATVKETLYSILQADAQLTGGGQLGDLLGKSATTPFGIYFSSPPVEPDPSYITYFISGKNNQKPENIFLNITAWGDNFEAILSRIRTLLDVDAGKNSNSFAGASDYSVKYFEFESEFPESYDDDLKAYFQTIRFRIQGWRN